MFYLLLLVACAFLASAKTVTYNFDVGWVTVSAFVPSVLAQVADLVKAAPDGFSRQVIGVNGQWP
jgi:iron transport multicopper oxidase